MTVTMIADDPPPLDLGPWLVDQRSMIETGEVAWLDNLAAFDRVGGWALDGQPNGGHWLRWKCRMARSTAYEKLRVAHELSRRPAVHDAFAAGWISYSAVRLITRLDDPDPTIDAILVDLATHATIGDLERAVRHCELILDQDKPPGPSPWDHRALRVRRDGHGMAQVVITVTDTEADELRVTLQAFLDRHPDHTDPGEESSPEDDQPTAASPGEESSAEDAPPTVEAAAPPVEESSPGDAQPSDPWPTRLVDAFMNMSRTGLAHAHDGQAVGADRYMVHLVNDIAAGTYFTLTGDPIPRTAFERISCDASLVEHLTNAGEPLNLGRKTRAWNRAQRRGIEVRDQRRCRWPGCTSHHGDIHHIQWVDQGGNTDIANGCYLCVRHHHLIHNNGYLITGDANHTLNFYRPDHTTLIGTTSPPGQILERP